MALPENRGRSHRLQRRHCQQYNPSNTIPGRINIPVRFPRFRGLPRGNANERTMTERNLPFRRRTVLKVAGITGVAAGTFAGRGSASKVCSEVEIVEPDGWGEMSLKKQLKLVEDETKAYRKPAEAAAAGYENTGLLGCKHGFSYDKTRGEDFGCKVHPLEPEIITYLLSKTKLELGAVEYVVDGDVEDDPPDLFNDDGEDLETTEADGWVAAGPGTSLHVWVHEDNPEGVFARRNPDFDDMPGCI